MFLNPRLIIIGCLRPSDQFSLLKRAKRFPRISLYLIQNNEKFDSLNRIDKNNHQLTNRFGKLIIADVFNRNKHNRVEIKYYWKEGDLASQKRYCSSKANLLHKF